MTILQRLVGPPQAGRGPLRYWAPRPLRELFSHSGALPSKLQDEGNYKAFAGKKKIGNHKKQYLKNYTKKPLDPLKWFKFHKVELKIWTLEVHCLSLNAGSVT